MALLFDCPECNTPIVVIPKDGRGFVRCYICGAQIPIPESNQNIAIDAEHLIPLEFLERDSSDDLKIEKAMGSPVFLLAIKQCIIKNCTMKISGRLLGLGLLTIIFWYFIGGGKLIKNQEPFASVFGLMLSWAIFLTGVVMVCISLFGIVNRGSRLGKTAGLLEILLGFCMIGWVFAMLVESPSFAQVKFVASLAALIPLTLGFRDFKRFISLGDYGTLLQGKISMETQSLLMIMKTKSGTPSKNLLRFSMEHLHFPFFISRSGNLIMWLQEKHAICIHEEL